MIDLPFFDDRHRHLYELAESLANTLSEDEADSFEAARHTAEILAAAGALKHSVPAPEDRHDVRSICLVREALSYRSSLADLMFAMQGLGSCPIVLAGSPAARAKFLAPIREARMIAAFAITEPDAGSDVAALKTTARRRGSEYVLDGEKTFISNAGLADVYAVFARTSDEPGHRGLSAFIVERDAPGFKFDGRIELIAPHPIGRISFEECRVPEDNRLGQEGDGFKIAMMTLDLFRPTVGAAAVGMAGRALDEAVDYSGKRVQFGQPIGEFQATRMRLAEMATEIDAARLLVYRAAWMKDRGADRVTLESAMAKLYATESAQRVIDGALQIHGGLGVIRGVAVERLYREIRALRIYEGTSEIQKLVIAGQLLGKTAKPEP